MNVLKALVGGILMIVGLIWGVTGLLYFAEGVYGVATTGQAKSSAEIFVGLTLFGMGAGVAWGGFRLMGGAPRSPTA